jgi:N6-adenosine-specific RNA methylase IME4
MRKHLLGEDQILAAAKAIRARRAQERHAERIRKLNEIAKCNAPIPTGRRFPIILADPPISFMTYNEVTGAQRSAQSHYPTLAVEQICALRVGELATDSAALFLWVPAPHLRHAFQIINAWGFSYRTNLVWVKDKIGLGYYARSQHEHLLICTRGKMPVPAPAQRPQSVITAPRREHSRKPDEAYALIERMYPELPKIELFARGQGRPGWAVWGNQAESADHQHPMRVTSRGKQ